MSNGLVNYDLLRKESWLTLTNHDVGMDIPQLQHALRASSSLRKLSLHAQFLASLDRRDVEGLFDAIAHVATLQELWMVLPNRNFLSPQEVLTRVLLASSSSSHLQKLTVRGVDDDGCRVVARALSQSDATVTELQLRGAANSTQRSVSRRGILYVASMLLVNKSLRRLDVEYDNGLDDDGCGSLADALKTNSTLQKLELKTNKLNSSVSPTNAAASDNNHASRASKTGYQAFVDMMHQNTTITHLHTSAALGTDVHTMMELLATLNRLGARTLFQRHTATREQIVDVLTTPSIHCDATALYELLTLNPSLWVGNTIGYCSGFTEESASGGGGVRSTAAYGRRFRSSCCFTIRQKAAALERTLGRAANARPSTDSSSSASKNTNNRNNNNMQPMKRQRGLHSSKPVLDRWNENIWAHSDRVAAQEFRTQRERRFLQQQQQQQQQQELVGEMEEVAEPITSADAEATATTRVQQHSLDHEVEDGAFPSVEAAAAAATTSTSPGTASREDGSYETEEQALRRPSSGLLSTVAMSLAVMIGAVGWSALSVYNNGSTRSIE